MNRFKILLAMNTKWFMNKLPSQHIFGIYDALLAGIRVEKYSYLACEAENRVQMI